MTHHADNDKDYVLDHGYVKLVEAWGSDERIIEAARMSTQKGFEGWGPNHEADCTLSKPYVGTASLDVCDCNPSPGDEKLLRYLWENNHATPFEMAGAVFEVQAPIFVFREWHRHRTQSYNEMSARYEPLPDFNYVPTVERLMMNAGGTNKQAGTVKGSRVLDELTAKRFVSKLGSRYAQAQEDYEMALADGVPKELARVLLPVGRYSRMRASANLRNWLGFLTLRDDPRAQWEIRQYAQKVRETLAVLFPRTLSLFEEGRR